MVTTTKCDLTLKNIIYFSEVTYIYQNLTQVNKSSFHQNLFKILILVLKNINSNNNLYLPKMLQADKYGTDLMTG